MYLLIVTGMSGAGKSHALKKLEDIGFFCVDNLPAALISSFVDLSLSKTEFASKAAVGIDCREEMSFGQIYEKIAEIKSKGIETEILFLDAPDEILIKRYKETRRSHPMSRQGWIEEGIANERRAMRRLRDMADTIINTGGIRPAELYANIESIYSGEERIALFIKSFGFKYGLPLDADFVFDLRFLPNPYWNDELRQFSGLDKPIHDFVMRESGANEFLDQLETMVEKLLPGFIREGRKQVVVALGCTGGRHRSVCIAASFASRLTSKHYHVKLMHRDMDADLKNYR